MNKQALLFKALSDDNRIKILELLVKGESCSCELLDELPISQPTLSYHLKLLHEAGLIDSKKEGNRVNHKVKKDVLEELSSFLLNLTKVTTVCN
jgi:ArsR family transcriptional regulator